MTKYAVVNLHKDQAATTNTFLETLQIAVALSLTNSAKTRIHDPPKPYDISNLKQAVVVENTDNPVQIERHINPASQHHDPRVYLIRRPEQGGGDRCILATGKNGSLVLCELEIDPKYIGKPHSDEYGLADWSKFKRTFDWVSLFLFDVDGRGVRRWRDLAKAGYFECDAAEEPWEAEANDEQTDADAWEKEA